MKQTKGKISIREMTVFAMFAALMLASKLLMEALPNIHVIGMFTMLLTVVYRKRALIPLYIYIFLNGLLGGFALWWVPYLYIWFVLWGVTMLLPKSLPPKWASVMYAVVCSLHGFCYGLLYAPFQALVFHLDSKALLAWIVAGFYFDVLHGIGNFCLGFLIYPLAHVLQKLKRRY